MNLSVADFVVIGIILVFVIIGFAKGFIKMFFSLSKKILATLGAYLLTSPVRNVLIDTQIGNTIRNTILDWLVSKNEFLFNTPDLSNEMLNELQSSLKIPDFLFEIIREQVANSISVNPTETLGSIVSNTLAYYVVTILSFIVLFIILIIGMSIISAILSKIMEAPILNAINRLTGLAVGLVIGLVIVSLGMLCLSGISNWFNWGNEFISTYIDPTNESFGVARWLYNNNLLVYFIRNTLHL